ncbi:MAG: hypothetical protein ACR2Q3_18430 [Woeseiaceae bacterium]
MIKKSSIIILGFLLPIVSYGQDNENYACKMGDLTRRVEIVHETGVSVPCEVHYYKDDEAPGQQQVLWRALNEVGYCEAKMTEFVGQLLEMGWECGVSAAAREEPPVEEGESDVLDDTEALAPAPPQVMN